MGAKGWQGFSAMELALRFKVESLGFWVEGLGPGIWVFSLSFGAWVDKVYLDPGCPFFSNPKPRPISV